MFHSDFYLQRYEGETICMLRLEFGRNASSQFYVRSRGPDECSISIYLREKQGKEISKLKLKWKM